MTKTATLKLGVCAAALVLPGMSNAQGNASSTSADGQEQVLGEILVTARKRAERLQDVPISASVLSAAALQASGVRNLQDIQTSVPAVTITHAGPTDRLFVRGIGSGDNPAFDQAVATFIDDVYHGRSRGTASGLFDLERTEFLKGPQSLFFGNSAIAGAINVSTARPTQSVAGYVFGSYNFDFDRYIVEAATGGPLTSTLSARMSAMFGSGDGWIADTTGGQKVPVTEDRAGRLQFLWEPADNFTVNLKAEVGRFNQEGGLLGQIIQCPPVIATPTQNGFPGPRAFCVDALAQGDDVRFNDRRSTSRGGHSDLSNKEFVLKADYEFGGAVLTSNTAYFDYDYQTQFDLDFTSLDTFSAGAPEEYEQFSQEFRLASTGEGFLQYTAGLYYQHDQLEGANNLNYNFLTPLLPVAAQPYAPLGQHLTFDQTEDIYAAFASLAFNVTDQLKISGGVRAQRVEKEVTKGIFYGTSPGFFDRAPALFPGADAIGSGFGLGPAGSWDFDREDSKLTPSANIQYQFSRDLMVYASYANGFKAGGFNVVSTGPINPATGRQDDIPFEPETVDSFEIGMKSQLFDRRLTLNIAAFHSRYSDLQVGGNRQTTAGPVNVVSNAASSIAKGIEVEADLTITDALKTSLQFSLLDAHYENFSGALPTACQLIVGHCVFGATTPALSAQDLSGEPTPYAADYSGIWRIDYQMPVGRAFDVALGSSLFFTDHFQVAVNNDPATEQDAYVQLDLSARLINTAHDWEVGLLVKNANDVDTFHWAAALPRSAGTYTVQKDAPRSFTMQFRKGF